MSFDTWQQLLEQTGDVTVPVPDDGRADIRESRDPASRRSGCASSAR